jgi:methyl-accepting chemotaxis protein
MAAPPARHTEPARKPVAVAVDRRGPNRAKNVVRPAFRPVAAAPVAASAKTGTEDWESF